LVEAVPGHLHPGQEEWLFNAARELPDGSDILEVGPHRGRSTCALALGCLGGGKHIYSIDTFRGKWEDTDVQGPAMYLGEFLANLDSCGVAELVTPMVGYSSSYWAGWNKPIGMLFVDGGHQWEAVHGDLSAFFPWLVGGGLLAVHDVWGDSPTGRDTERAWCEFLPRLSDHKIEHNLAWGWKA